MDAPQTRKIDRPVSPAHLASRCTVIARDVALGCEIASALPVLVAGKVAGVDAPAVAVARDAVVMQTVMAPDSFIEGSVGGSVHGRVVSLAPTARVHGDVICERLYIAPGAVVGGRTHPSMRLTRSLASSLARVARSGRAASGLAKSELDLLAGEGLVFCRGGAVFVSLLGHLELARRWRRCFGNVPNVYLHARATDSCPPELRLATEAVSRSKTPLTVLADDVRIKGDVSTRGDLHVRGDVAGSLSARCVFIGDAARIAGSVAALDVCAWGRVDGDLSARNVVLQTTARIAGSVAFQTIDARGGARYGRASQLRDANAHDRAQQHPFNETAASIESAIAAMPAAA